MKNIELKTKYPDLKLAEQKAVELDAKFVWCKKQVDSYFKVPNGRLKLREAEGEATELISYFRDNKYEGRESNYHLLKIKEGKQIKQMLTGTIGLLAVVKKKRKLYIYENIRIHLDEVEKLGNFLEFEGVIYSSGEITGTKKRLKYLTEYFDIKKKRLVKYSYSDLIMSGDKVKIKKKKAK